MEIRRGAGAYICGEESNDRIIEGKRGLPRHNHHTLLKRVYLEDQLDHNIETLFWIPEILTKGAKWFAGLGFNENHKGLDPTVYLVGY